MACSKYISTKETTNAARVSRLLVDPCTDLFRDILRNNVTEIQFPFVLAREESVLSRILNKEQKSILYPKTGQYLGSYQEFDLSLLYTLLRNISGITPHKKGWGKPPDPSDRSLSANIDRAREIRNTYCGHAAHVSLSDGKFHDVWKDLTTIIGELKTSVHVGCLNYSDAAKLLKTVTMDPEQEERYLCIIDTQKKTIEEIKEEGDRTSKELKDLSIEFREGQRTQERHTSEIDDLTSRQRKLEEHVKGLEITKDGDRISKELKDLTIEFREGQKTNMYAQERHTSEIDALTSRQRKIEEHLEGLDTEGRNVLESTKVVLQNHKSRKEYTKTSAVKAIVQKIKDGGIIILTGKGGSGKTTTAYQVLCEMSDKSLKSPYIPVLIKSPQQWDKIIDPRDRYAVFIDDIFGSTNLDKMAVEKWKNHLDVILGAAKKGNVVVLIGLKKNTLDDARKQCPHEVLEKRNVTNLSSEYKITQKEKKEMLKAFEFKCNLEVAVVSEDLSATKRRREVEYKLSDQEIESIISTEPYYGFPLTCFLFFTRQDFFQQGCSFFKHTNEMLCSQVEEMRKVESGRIKNAAYCVLSYILINGNIDTQNILDDLFRTVCKKIRLFDVPEIEIKDGLNYLESEYFTHTTESHVYEFSHETVLESILVSFGNIDPKVVIERCSKRKLFELIRTQNCPLNSGEVVLKIPKNCYECLAARLLQIDNGDGGENEPWRIASGIAWHPVADDPEFADTLLNLAKSGRTKPIFSESVGNESLQDYLLSKRIPYCRKNTRHSSHQLPLTKRK